MTQSIAILDTLRGVLDIRTDPKGLICSTLLEGEISRKDVLQTVHPRQPYNLVGRESFWRYGVDIKRAKSGKVEGRKSTTPDGGNHHFW